MTKNRITCVLLAVFFVLAAVLSSCQQASPAPEESAHTTEAASDANIAGDTEQNTDTEGTSDTSGDDSGDAPTTGGIVPPVVEGTASTPLMWHVISEDGGELYLLGSIHVGLEDTCLFPDTVYDAFDACDALAVESDVIALENDLAASVKAMRLMVYTDGSSIRAHVDDASYEAAKALMEDAGYYNRFMDYYCPVVWQQMIDQILAERTEYKYENGVDRYFLSEAKRLGKDVLEIEDYMETYGALASLSENTQAFLLRESISEEAVASYSNSLAQLYSLWKAGNLSEVEEYLLEDEAADATDYTREEIMCMMEYNTVLLMKRNTLMIEKADEYLRSGKRVFYVVGLAHMVGEGGIVESLSSMGYDVQQIH